MIHVLLALMRILKLPDGDSDESYEWDLLVPTSWGYPETRTMGGPADVDRERIQTFVDGANSLIEDDARREVGGFRFSEADFKFERMPEWALHRPILSTKDLRVCPRWFTTRSGRPGPLLTVGVQDMIHAGRESFKLWGLSTREFLRLT